MGFLDLVIHPLPSIHDPSILIEIAEWVRTRKAKARKVGTHGTELHPSGGDRS